MDPFATDPFWDSWDEPPKAAFDSSDEEESQLLEEFHSSDWSIDPAVKAARREAEKKRIEDRNQRVVTALAAFITKEEATKEKAAEEETPKEAAEALAAENAVAWRLEVEQEVERAYDLIKLAKPVKALHLLSSLSETEAFKNIDPEEQQNINQLYVALYKHYDI